MEQHDIYDFGLTADVSMLMRSAVDRRRVLKLGAIGLTALLTGCQPPAGPGGGGAPPAGEAVATSVSSCSTNIPGETAGPYPADGSSASSQSLNALDISGIVRQDIRTSIGTGNVAEGIPMKLELTLVNTNAECAPLAGYAIYAWHCTRDGNYSMYSEGVTDEDFLRGVQPTDAAGKVTFQTIFPGCYLGRWPHVHFEIYPTLEKATGQSNVVRITQLGLPESDCQAAYTNAGYESSAKNLPQITLATDNVFSDGYESQIATVSGNATDGYVAQLTIGIAV